MLNQESLIDDITRRAHDGLLAEAYGRDREMFAIMEVLSRRNRKNVILTGYSGVGKRRIVEGLALLGMQGETQGLLGEIRVVELNLSLLAQGAEQHAKALAGLIKHLRQTRDIVLFIPDIDLVLDPGDTGLGDSSLSTLLRPTLLRGDITCIGAMTPGRYREVVEEDSVARRAFEVIHIAPMTESQAYEVITAIRPEIETHHNVEIADETVRAAVILSERYIKHQFLPGKAIDILDRASSRYRLKKLAKDRKPELVDDASLVLLKDRVSPHDVRKAVEKLVGFEIRASYSAEYWDEMAATFRRRMTGQKAAIAEGVAALRTAFDQLRETSGPKCVLLLVGSEHSGKHYWASILAEYHLGHGHAVVEVDIDTDSDECIAQALGRKGGKAGESGLHTDSAGMAVPEMVVLVKGIDTASGSGMERLRQLLDGPSPGSGRVDLSLQNGIVLLVSEKAESLPQRVEYSDSPKSWRVGLRQLYPPDILNRVNAIVPFFPLEFRHHHAIMRNDVNALRRRLSKRGVTVIVHRRTYQKLSEQCTGGVDELRRTLYSELIRPVEELTEAPEGARARSVQVDIEEGSIVCRLEREEQAAGTDDGLSPR